MVTLGLGSVTGWQFSPTSCALCYACRYCLLLSACWNFAGMADGPTLQPDAGDTV